MAIKIELNTNLAMQFVREDLVENLGWDGLDVLIDFYNEEEDDIEFDNALFWVWHRYDSARAACEDRGIEVDKEDFDGEPLDDDEIEDNCLRELERNTKVFVLDDGSVVVNTEF